MSIGKITAPVCVGCHADSLGVTQLTTKQESFANTLEALKAMLTKKGFVYSSTYPYFNNTDWGSGQSGAETTGAAFNYVLLAERAGSLCPQLGLCKTTGLVILLIISINGNITGSC